MKQVTAAVIIEDGRLLLTRRSPNSSVPGAWELPGGKIEEGETPQECLERELLEELQLGGIAGAVLARSEYKYDHGSFELLAIEFTRSSEFTLDPTIHDDYIWALPDEAGNLYLAPADVPLIAALFPPP